MFVTRAGTIHLGHDLIHLICSIDSSIDILSNNPHAMQ